MLLCDAALFAPINVPARRWEVARTVGLVESDPKTELVLQLTKEHAEMRWTHVFARDDGVLESLDPVVVREYAAHMAMWGDSLVDTPHMAKFTAGGGDGAG